MIRMVMMLIMIMIMMLIMVLIMIASCTSPSQTTARLPTAQMIFALLIRMVMILLTTKKC